MKIIDKIQLPRVTISIPTYNHEKFIAKAIESALSQDYDNLEINVSDDCSGDATFKICQSYMNHPNICIYQNKKNLGRVENYKKLLYEYATGDWVVNLDGDDHFTSASFISDAIAAIQKSINVVLYHANFFDIKKFRKFYNASFSKDCKLVSGQDYVLNRCFVRYFFHLSALYKRDVALRCGFYSYNSLNTDALSLRTLALYGNVILDSKKVGEWQLTEASETHKSFSESEVKKFDKANAEYLNFLRSNISSNKFELYLRNLEKSKKQTNLYNAIQKKDLVAAQRLLLNDFAINGFYLKQLIKFILCKMRLL